MHSQATIAKLFFQTFDSSAVELFRSHLARHPRVKKWMIAADFVQHDPERPMDCMAFTFLPYDEWPKNTQGDLSSALPRDLKKSKELTPEAVEWLRDDRRFHIVITLNKDRRIFFNGPGSDTLKIVREHVDLTITAIADPKYQDTLKRFKQLRQNALANNFRTKLLADIWLLGIFFAALTILLGRERECEVIGWFPDRDDMTNYCDGIWHDYAFWATHSFTESLGFDVDLSKTRIAVGVPDRSGPKEVMWFDYMIRAADWFAGVAAAWNREENKIPGERPKYRQMLEQVIADADNVVLLHCDIDDRGAQFRRIAVTRSDPNDSDDAHADAQPSTQ